jgi:hypothetical protein
VVRPGWRDLRLWAGVVLVAASVVGGARLFAAADDTVTVWAVAADAGPGARVDPDDLVARRVRFGDADDLRAYFRTEDRLPADLRLTREVTAGELLPRAAVGSAAERGDTVELPVAVDAEQVPPAVGTGSVVDVYLLGRRGGAARPGPVLEAATVVDAPSLEATFGTTTGRRQLVLAVRDGDAAAFLGALGRVDQPVLTVLLRE